MVAAEETLGLAALSSGELSEITSRVTGLPFGDPVVSVTPVAYNWGSPATAGLWRVDVTDAGEVASCAYFVKLLRHTRLWPGLGFLPDDASRADFIEHFPWRAELDMYESEIGAVLPEGLRTPVLHHVSYSGVDHIALWWEFVPQRPVPWQLADYRRAAYLLGRLAARRREGAEVNRRFQRCAGSRSAAALRCGTSPSAGFCAAQFRRYAATHCGSIRRSSRRCSARPTRRCPTSCERSPRACRSYSTCSTRCRRLMRTAMRVRRTCCSRPASRTR